MLYVCIALILSLCFSEGLTSRSFLGTPYNYSTLQKLKGNNIIITTNGFRYYLILLCLISQLNSTSI